MTQYLVAIYHPDDYDPSTEDEAMSRDINALNDEMKAARVRFSLAACHRPEARGRNGRSPAGKVLVTDGPYVETKEHTGGFWVLEAADLEEDLAWGARLLSPVGCRSRYAV